MCGYVPERFGDGSWSFIVPLWGGRVGEETIGKSSPKSSFRLGGEQ